MRSARWFGDRIELAPTSAAFAQLWVGNERRWISSPTRTCPRSADAFELRLETKTKQDLFSEKSSYKGQARDSIAWLSVKLEGGVIGWPEGTDDLDGHQCILGIPARSIRTLAKRMLATHAGDRHSDYLENFVQVFTF
jgi:hypothetical protein